MKRNLNRFFLSAIILSALAFGFQNCGEASHVANPDPNEQAQFFAYSYSTNPNFLVSMNLFRPTGAIANLTSFKYFSTVAFPEDSSAPIAYEVKVRTPAGALVCPTQSGTLIAGLSFVEFDCVSIVAATRALVEFRVTAKGKTETFEQVYEN